MYKRIVDAKLYIDEHYLESIDLDKISDQANFSKYHFLRLFKKSFGKSPHQYLIELRLSEARRLLKNKVSVKETCFQVGFESVPSFVRLFKRREGLTPNEYAKKLDRLEQEKLASPFSFIPGCFASSYGWNKQ